jgi:hypothetical protein
MDIKEMVWSRFISRLGITGAVLWTQYHNESSGSVTDVKFLD